MKRSAPLVRTTSLKSHKPMARGTTPMRARKKGKPQKTAAEKEHMGKVAELGCILCRVLQLGQTPAELHHPRYGAGMGMKRPHMDVIPLCPEHHRGKTGVHGLGGKGFTETYGVTEDELLERTRALIGA